MTDSSPPTGMAPVGAAAAGPESAAPVLMAFAGSAPQRRITVFFRLLLIIPQFIVLFFVGIAAEVVVVIGWFGALFMGRLPGFAADFLPGYVRWQARVFSYELLLTDVYPPFSLENDDAFPVWITARPGRLNRAAVFFRFLLLIPVSLLAGLLVYGFFPLLAFITWCIVVVSGRMPPSLYQALASVVRYQTRVNGFALMITSEYPWGLFGDRPVADAPPAYGHPQAVAPAPAFAPAPVAPVAPAVPIRPGATITFGGPSYLWGYSDDRSICGIWSAPDPTALPQTWPIGEQGDAWTRFWQLEPGAVEFGSPPAPPVSPSWAPPAVAAPAYVTSGSPLDDPRWRLVLSAGAKRLVTLMLVLGVLTAGAFIAVSVGSKTLQGLVTNVQVQADYATLNSAVSSYNTALTSCQAASNELTCLTGAARTVGQAFGTFQARLDGLSEPTGAASPAAVVETDSVEVQTLFQQLARSSSLSAYQQAATSAQLTAALTQFSADYQKLVNALNAAG